ncbi:carboxypeptidase A4 in complex with A cleaved hexapeptide, partial [Syncephalis fuscata]
SNWHDSYHRLADIEHFFETLAIVYPDLVRVERFGQTYQQRQLLRVSLGLQSRSEEPKRQRIWIQALQHAREWIAGATVQYIADRLTSGYGKDPNITWLLDNAEIVLVPVANPDGYEFSWTRERLWRKNRHQLSRQVFGVDTNRNWPDHWNTGGSSTNPRSEVYMGTGPASELEVQSLMNEFRATPNVVGAIDYHSYSQLFLYPVGYTQKPAQHQKQFVEMGRLFRKAVGNQTNFKVEQSSELYIASGGVDDWWYSDEVAAERGYHVPGLCIELNPDEDSLTGFIIPASNIRPIGEEQTRGLVALALHFISNPLL